MFAGQGNGWCYQIGQNRCLFWKPSTQKPDVQDSCDCQAIVVSTVFVCFLFVTILPWTAIQTPFYKPHFLKYTLLITLSSALDNLPCLHHNSYPKSGQFDIFITCSLLYPGNCWFVWTCFLFYPPHHTVGAQIPFIFAKQWWGRVYCLVMPQLDSWESFFVDTCLPYVYNIMNICQE